MLSTGHPLLPHPCTEHPLPVGQTAQNLPEEQDHFSYCWVQMAELVKTVELCFIPYPTVKLIPDGSFNVPLISAK